MSDSLMSRPARNAPSASDSPNSSLTYAVPSATATTRQHEHLAAAQQRDALEQPRQHVQAQAAAASPGTAAPCRPRWRCRAVRSPPCDSAVSSDDEHDRRQVLEHGPAQGDVAVRRVELAALAQDLGDHGARRLADEGAEEQRLERREAQRHGDEVAQRRPSPTTCTTPPTMAMRRTRERSRIDSSRPDGEEQEDQADVGQRGDGVAVGDRPGRVRPDQHAGRDVAQDRRLAEAHCNRRTDRRRRSAQGRA